MFNATYKNDVKVEQIIMNLPSPSSYSESGYDSDSTATLGAAKNIPDCKIIKAHTGQKFYIRNAIIEILSTIDSFLPQPLTNFNNSSMVFTVDVEGERSLYLGDISEDVAKILVPMYGDYLKSDILQLAHHGKRNGYGRSMPNMIKLYSLVRPEVVFWPSSHEHYLDDSLDEAYQMSKFTWNLEALKSARECYIAGGYITVLELPYTMYSAYNYDPSVKRDPVFADTPSSTDSLTYNETCYDKTIDKVDWND
jgi:hypothetical protein